MRIRFYEPQAGMRGMRAMNHRRAKIDPDAYRRLDCGEQPAFARAQFQNAHPGRNQEPVEFGESIFIAAAQHVEAAGGFRIFLPVGDAGFGVGGLLGMDGQYSSVMASRVLSLPARDPTPRISPRHS